MTPDQQEARRWTIAKWESSTGTNWMQHIDGPNTGPQGLPVEVIELAPCQALVEAARAIALQAQGELEPVIGLLRLKGEVGSGTLPHLEAAHAAIKRIVDGDNWRERWEAVNAGKPDPGRLPPSPFEEGNDGR